MEACALVEITGFQPICLSLCGSLAFHFLPSRAFLPGWVGRPESVDNRQFIPSPPPINIQQCTSKSATMHLQMCNNAPSNVQQCSFKSATMQLQMCDNAPSKVQQCIFKSATMHLQMCNNACNKMQCSNASMLQSRYNNAGLSK